MGVIGEFTVGSPLLENARARVPEMVLELQELHITEGGPVAVLFWARDGEFREFEEGLREDPTVDKYSVRADLDDRRLYDVRVTDAGKQAMAYPFGQSYDMEILSALVTDSEVTVRAVFPDRDAIDQYHQYCTERGIECTVQRVFIDATDKRAANAER